VSVTLCVAKKRVCACVQEIVPGGPERLQRSPDYEVEVTSIVRSIKYFESSFTIIIILIVHTILRIMTYSNLKLSKFDVWYKK
jgi:hypothetical protein